LFYMETNCIKNKINILIAAIYAYYTCI
jgi:hypothetical protein